MRMRLGDILIAQGVIDGEELKSALAEAALWGRRVGEVLVSQGTCDEEQILGALSRQLNVEAAPLSTTVVIPERVLALVPADFARKHLVVPLYDDPENGVLEVALSDPADQERLDELRFHTGREIRPLVALPSELEEAILRFYSDTAPALSPIPALKIAVARTPTPAPEQVEQPKNTDSEVFGSESPNLSGDHCDIEIEATSAPLTPLHGEIERLRADVDALLAAQSLLIAQLESSGAFDARAFRRDLQQRLDPGDAA